jgi:hypothetical protein
VHCSCLQPAAAAAGGAVNHLFVFCSFVLLVLVLLLPLFLGTACVGGLL